MLNIKKLFTALMCGVFVTNTLGLSTFTASAATGDSRTFVYDDYEIIYNVTNSWADTEAVTVNITNTGDETIENWMLYFEPNGEITSIWNAQEATSASGYTYYKNAGYNSSIASGASTSFSYLVDNCTDIPEDFIMCQKIAERESGYSVSVMVDQSWDGGFNGTIILTNNTDTAIEDWELTFDTNFTITEITSSWAGTITTLEPYSYMLKGSYTNVIAANSSIYLGFSGVKNGTPEITSSSLTEVTVDEEKILCGMLLNGSISFDDLDDSDNDRLPDIIERKIGTSETNADSDGDGLPDGYEVFSLDSDPLNQNSFDSNVSDGDCDSDTDGLSNYLEYQLGTDPHNSDSDYDGLTDGQEYNTYHSNPLDEDTDDDEISDGDEVALGLNPLLADSDNDGVLDNEEKFNQSITFEGAESDELIDEVSIAFEGTGYINSTTSIESVMDVDWMCSNVVGLVGEPYDISTTSDFDEATVTFAIDSSVLGSTDFENLLVLWYDETTQRLVDMEAALDSTNYTLTFTTSHFSKYLIVDCDEWYEAWTDNYYPTSNIVLHTAITIDCSSSMSYNDPNRCRIDAAKGFVEIMGDNDMASVTLFASHVNSNSLGTLTTDKNLLNQTIDSVTSIGVTNYEEALQYSINSLDVSNNTDSENIIIFLSDGYPTNSSGQAINPENFDYTIVDTAASMGIKIYTIGLTDNVCETILMEMAERTDGEYFYANTAEELVPYFLNVNMSEKYDLVTDNDEDGIPDLFETYGMPIANGNVLFSSPQSVDTDNDTIPDGDEVNVVYVNGDNEAQLAAEYVSQYYPEIEVNAYGGIYFKMNSNPSNEDTDGDLDLDNADPDPLSYQLNGYFASKVGVLQDIANEYLESVSESAKQSKYYNKKDFWLVSYYIRQFVSRYDKGNFVTACGQETAFAKYVKVNYPEINQYFSTVTELHEAKNSINAQTDTYHMFCTLSSLLYKYTDDLGWLSLFAPTEVEMDNYTGWAGDLQTTINQAFEEMSNYDSYYESLYIILQDDNHNFGPLDLYADVDAVNIANLIKNKNNDDFESLLNEYYSLNLEEHGSNFYSNVPINDSTIRKYIVSSKHFISVKLTEDQINDSILAFKAFLNLELGVSVDG